MLKHSYNIINIKVGFAHLFLFLVFLVGASNLSVGQGINDFPQIRNAYDNILKLKLSKGRQQLELVSEDGKRISHFIYVKNFTDILELLVTQDEALYKKINHNEDENLKKLKSLSDQDPYKLFYESEVKLQWSLVKTLFGDDIRAGLSIRSAYHSIQKNKRKFPEFLANNKTLGLLHILLSTLPDNPKWFFGLLGIRGDLETGISEIAEIESYSPYYLESQIISLLVNINILNKENESLEQLESLLRTNKDNLLLNYIYCSALVKYNKSEQALAKLLKLQYHSKDYLFLHYIHYQLGQIHIQKQAYQIARNYYALFLNSYRGKDLIKDAWFKISLTYWLSDDQKMTHVHFKKAKSSGRTFADADKNANGILDENKFPNKSLMKLRLATDGGYFELASRIQSKITENTFETKKEKAEYHYRIGRFNHISGDLEEAIYSYLHTIKKSGSEHWYFAPNACLETGYIYQQKNDLTKAKFYFEKALTYKKHKYKSSIDRKAKAALASIN